MALISTSKLNKHVFYSQNAQRLDDSGRLFQAGWYFWDEVGLLGNGPYQSEQDAINGLKDYAENCLASGEE